MWFGTWNGENAIYGVSKDLSKQQAALEKFERFFDYNPALMAVTDLDTSQITEVNMSFMEKLGYRREEIIGKTGKELRLFINTEKHQAALDDLIQNGSLRDRELLVRKKDGGYLHCLFSGVIIDNQGKQILLTVGIDLTQQKEIEKELETARLNMKAMLDNEPYAAWLKDRDLRFVDVNRAFLEALSVKREDIIGKTDTAIWPGEFARKLEAENEAIIKSSEKIYRVEWDAQGTRCYERFISPVVDNEGSVVGITGFSRDITDRILLEEELRSQKTFLQQILNSIPDLIFYKDTRSVYLGSNKAFSESYLGIAPEDFIGKTDFNINPDKAQAENFRQRDKAAMQAGIPRSNEETIFLADGRAIDVETIKTPFYDENGKLAGLIGISRNITARRHTEEKLRRSEIALKAAKEELERKNKSLTAAYEQLQIIAATDQMTKLLNRWSVLKLIEQEQMRFKRYRRPFSVIIADIDAFKAINDTYGHNFGDHVIITVSELFKSSVRAQDHAARWGGEEFLIFLPETHLEGAAVLAEKLRSLVAEYIFEKDGISAHATITFGISVYEKEQALDQLIGMADKAMYIGKTKDKNTVVSQMDIS